MKPLSRTSPLTLAAVLTTVAVLTTACGGTDSGTAGDPGTGTAAKPVEITYWSWMPGTKETAEAFNAAHDDVKVRFSEVPAGLAGGYDKLAKGVKAGNGPDVMNVEYQALPDLVTQGLLADSSELLGDTVRKSPEQVRSLVTLGGKQWAAPFDVGPQIMYYRKDLFEKHKIDVPTTWEEYRSAAEKIKKVDPASRATSFWSDDVATWAALAQQAGAQWYAAEGDAWKVDIDGPATNKVADYWGDLVEKDLVFNHKAWSPASTKATTDGHVWTRISASWGAGGLKTEQPAQAGKWASAPMPGWGDGRIGMAGGSSFAIVKNSDKAAAAAKFITWATTDEAAVRARLSLGTSSALPADEKLRAAAAASFDTKFYGSQDIYATASAQAAKIRDGWVWSPVHNATSVELTAALGKAKTGDFWPAFAQGQAAAEKLVTDRGLRLAK
ncbi:ABC transporter substrate-binding protein [Streptomyces candidus]|uniref:Multiple sugar transport system substrate-binding protein n=1 Tax=Streptomyces candidus TaxID=67283 RepID=A0A7X0HH10_9ACTN|nr:extracellular solute-binding protein [Streptomyces candidus]MBB6436013.1 multiple sugar transport system substrate-binding protein [Streptomyces candidus]GHH43338.1 sugar ABC transporter substrate-binding protein [Streptomyces candidus]